MSDTLDWNAKTSQSSGRTRAELAGTSKAPRWSWYITAAAKAGGSTSTR
jgi:hypothetical protein